MEVPAGVTQEEGHTGFLIHLPSAVPALIFLARGVRPFLSLVDREVEFLYIYIYIYIVGEIPIVFTGIRTQVPTCQKVLRLPTEPLGQPAVHYKF